MLLRTLWSWTFVISQKYARNSTSTWKLLWLFNHSGMALFLWYWWLLHHLMAGAILWTTAKWHTQLLGCGSNTEILLTHMYLLTVCVSSVYCLISLIIKISIDGYYALLAEFMPGGSLYDFLHKNHNVLKLPQLLKFAIDVCRGMEYLHQNDIIHRDLKTANLLMDTQDVRIDYFAWIIAENFCPQ